MPASFLLLAVVAAVSSAIPLSHDRTERNVFPPYKFIFNDPAWQEIWKLLNETNFGEMTPAPEEIKPEVPGVAARNVFPPYKPLFSDAVWQELLKIFNETNLGLSPSSQDPQPSNPDLAGRNIFLPFHPWVTDEDWLKLLKSFNDTSPETVPAVKAPGSAVPDESRREVPPTIIRLEDLKHLLNSTHPILIIDPALPSFKGAK